MKKVLRRLLGIVSLTVFLISFSAVAFATTYSTTFSFSVAVTGSTRSFTGSNISFYTKYATSDWKHATNKTYTVTLYRDNSWASDDKIGTVTLNRDSSGTAKWSAVGSGNYYTYLVKANDGVTLSSSKVTIANY